MALDIYVPRKWPYSTVFTRNAFDAEKDIANLEGKVILVTGGNAGLGKETIFWLARHFPKKIYLAARSKDRAVKAIDHIRSRLEDDINNGNGDRAKTSIEFLELDLADLHSVKAAADHVLKTEYRLDTVILNAGVMATPPVKTEQGYDLQLGTNYIGHFLLANLLLPLLEDTALKSTEADVRVVTVSSEAHNMAPPTFVESLTTMKSGTPGHELLCEKSPYSRYGISKAANILFAAELARRCSDKHITSVSLHPGLILTDLYGPAKDSTLILRSGLPTVASLVFDDIKQGALNQLWCAAAADPEGLVSGSYYTPIGVQRQNKWTESVDEATQLWDWTTRTLKEAGFL